MVVEAHDDRADHVVQARAEPAAGDDGGAGAGGVEEDSLARPGQLERRRRLVGPEAAPGGLEAGVEQNALAVVDEAQAAHRRVDPALTQACDDEVFLADSRGVGIAQGTFTGAGTTSQIVAAYSRIARSDDKEPACAVTREQFTLERLPVAGWSGR